jgi:hypothetical protein
LGQAAHFFGDHCEALARIPGTGCLDGRIERQQIGLEGDLVDGLDYFCRFVGRILDLGDRCRHPVDGVGPLPGIFKCLAGYRIGLLGIVGILLGHGGDFFQ